ncbi:pentapeptide repeat-containing protein [Micromonospora trifolii]|uniref:pentapeptide repeat-containing protein n=1 Tax=Micromonospora trifolii TaxID=2911208 RepID=UPI003555DD5C
MVGCSAGKALFRSARLFAVQLDDAVLEGADLRHAILNSAKLYRTDLRDANLERASLRWCTLGGTGMPTVLTGARMFGCQFEGAKGVVVGPVLVDEEATGFSGVPSWRRGSRRRARSTSRWWADATAQTIQGRSPLGPALSLVLLRRAEDTRFELVRV